MKRTEQSIKTSIYNLIPEEDGIFSAKVQVMLLHSYRIIKNFVGSNSKLKNHLKSTLAVTVKDVKLRSIDFTEFTGLFQGIDVSEIYTPERREVWSKAKQNNKKMNFEDKELYFIKNSRNVDIKALDENTEEQQFCSNINSLLNNSSNYKIGVFYRTDKSIIDEFSVMLHSYLEQVISEKEMKKYISSIKL